MQNLVEIRHLKLDCHIYRAVAEDTINSYYKSGRKPVNFELILERMGLDILPYEYQAGSTVPYGRLIPSQGIILIDPVLRSQHPMKYRETIATLLGVHLHLLHYQQLRFPGHRDFDDFLNNLSEQDRKRLIVSGQVMAGLIGASPDSLRQSFWSSVESMRAKWLDMRNLKALGNSVELSLAQLSRVVHKLRGQFQIPTLWLYRRIKCSGFVQLDPAVVPAAWTS